MPLGSPSPRTPPAGRRTAAATASSPPAGPQRRSSTSTPCNPWQQVSIIAALLLEADILQPYVGMVGRKDIVTPPPKVKGKVRITLLPD